MTESAREHGRFEFLDLIVNTSEKVQNLAMKESGDGKEGGGVVLGYPMTLCALCR